MEWNSDEIGVFIDCSEKTCAIFRQFTYAIVQENFAQISGKSFLSMCW